MPKAIKTVQFEINCIANNGTIYTSYVIIKTYGSESQGQEEAAVCNKRVSYLHIALL